MWDGCKENEKVFGCLDKKKQCSVLKKHSKIGTDYILSMRCMLYNRHFLILSSGFFFCSFI